MSNLAYILLALTAIGALLLLAVQGGECSQQGGQFVRTLLWYTCIGVE